MSWSPSFILLVAFTSSLSPLVVVVVEGSVRTVAVSIVLVSVARFLSASTAVACVVVHVARVGVVRFAVADAVPTGIPALVVPVRHRVTVTDGAVIVAITTTFLLICIDTFIMFCIITIKLSLSFPALV